MKRILLALVALVLIGAAALYFARDRIALALFEFAVQRGISADTIAGLPNGLTAGFAAPARRCRIVRAPAPALLSSPASGSLCSTPETAPPKHLR